MEGKVQYRGQWIEVTSIPGPTPPEVGSDVYVPSAWYMFHGVDDFQGGLCKVTSVKLDTSGGEPAWFITVHERPGYSYNWSSLSERQDELRAEHGTARGYPDPDNDPEANRW